MSEPSPSAGITARFRAPNLCANIRLWGCNAADVNWWTSMLYLAGAYCWIVNASFSGWPAQNKQFNSYVLGTTSVCGALLFHLGAMCQLRVALKPLHAFQPLGKKHSTLGLHSILSQQYTKVDGSSLQLYIAGTPPASAARGGPVDVAELAIAGQLNVPARPMTLQDISSGNSINLAHRQSSEQYSGETANLLTEHKALQQVRLQEDKCSSAAVSNPQLNPYSHCQTTVSGPVVHYDSQTPLVPVSISGSDSSASNLWGPAANCQRIRGKKYNGMAVDVSATSTAAQSSAAVDDSLSEEQELQQHLVAGDSLGGASVVSVFSLQSPCEPGRAAKRHRRVWWCRLQHPDKSHIPAVLQVIGTTIFLGACICGSSGVLPNNLPAGDWIYWDVCFWAPCLVGSCLFITSSVLWTVEIQFNWWLPATGCITWWLSLANVIGSIGFWLCSFFGFFTYPAQRFERWGMAFSCLWGSCCFAVGAYLQLFEVLNKHMPLCCSNCCTVHQ